MVRPDEDHIFNVLVIEYFHIEVILRIGFAMYKGLLRHKENNLRKKALPTYHFWDEVVKNPHPNLANMCTFTKCQNQPPPKSNSLP